MQLYVIVRPRLVESFVVGWAKQLRRLLADAGKRKDRAFNSVRASELALELVKVNDPTKD